MKLLRKASYALALAVLFSSTFQCSSSKAIATSTFENPTNFKIESVTFQEWYAGIKVGGTGINVYIPISEENKNVELESVYFRNLKGKLVKNEGKYMAILKNTSSLYTFQKPEKSSDYPFTLTDNEMVISYKENGQTKYYKTTQINEFAGTYYENGPPSIYENTSSTVVASTDEDGE